MSGTDDPRETHADTGAIPCERPPAGWHCTRGFGHDGPCPTVQDDPTGYEEFVVDGPEETIWRDPWSIAGPCAPSIVIQANRARFVIACGNCGVDNIASRSDDELTARELVEIIRSHQEVNHG